MERLQKNHRLGQNGSFEIKSPNNEVLHLEVENGNITVNPNTDGWQIERRERTTHGGGR